MNIRYFTTLALCATIPLLAASNSYAQANTNRAIMERLDRIERNMNQRQSGGYERSTDADAKSITSGNFDADLLQQVFTLQEEVRSLRGQIETNNFEISNLKNQVKLMQEDVDFRFKSLESSAAANQETLSQLDEPALGSEADFSEAGMEDSAELDSKKNDAFRPQNHIEVNDKPTTAGSGKLAKPGTNYGDEPRTHYNSAFRLLNQNRYDEAEASFKDFTQTYPDDPLIGNAYYWLGETHYINKNYLEAADNFREGYQKLPNGPKAPDNLLKLAITLKALDRTADACTVIEQINQKFKNASTSIIQRAKAEKKLMGCQ